MHLSTVTIHTCHGAESWKSNALYPSPGNCCFNINSDLCVNGLDINTNALLWVFPSLGPIRLDNPLTSIGMVNVFSRTSEELLSSSLVLREQQQGPLFIGMQASWMPFVTKWRQVVDNSLRCIETSGSWMWDWLRLVIPTLKSNIETHPDLCHVPSHKSEHSARIPCWRYIKRLCCIAICIRRYIHPCLTRKNPSLVGWKTQQRCDLKKESGNVTMPLDLSLTSSFSLFPALFSILHTTEQRGGLNNPS